MITRSQLTFHETFQPEWIYISKILELGIEEFKGTKFEISEKTGIPTGKTKGKVEPHIKYAAFMGLVEYELNKGIYSLEATPLGKEIFMQDKYLHENLTHWLCHYALSRETMGAHQWYYVIHEGHTGFSVSNSPEYHLQRANRLFSSDISLNEMFGVVRKAYTDGCFSDLNYLIWGEEVSFVEHFESPELVYAYAYVILDSWNQFEPGRSEIPVSDLNEVFGFNKIFNLNDEEFNNILDSLSSLGLLSINRMLYPATVIRNTSLEHVIPLLFDAIP